MVSRNNRPTPRFLEAEGPQVDIPRGSARSSRSYGRPTQRFGAQGGYGSSAQPRVSTVKVGSLAQGMRDERVHRTYRAHMAKAIVLLCLVAVLAATCFGVYWSSLFFSIKQLTVSGVEHLVGGDDAACERRAIRRFFASIRGR